MKLMRLANWAKEASTFYRNWQTCCFDASYAILSLPTEFSERVSIGIFGVILTGSISIPFLIRRAAVIADELDNLTTCSPWTNNQIRRNKSYQSQGLRLTWKT
jgi:hypothetical protein